jgi:hypothetical protein
MSNRVLAPERPWRRVLEPAVPRPIVWLRGLLEREALPVLMVALWLGLLAVAVPKLVVSDTWLALVDGRLIAQHGLPHTDTLAFWSDGKPWVDQQWGAHLTLYEAAAGGGLVAVFLLCVALVGLTLAVVALAGRVLGGSARSTAIGVAIPVLGAPWLAQVRTQTLVLPLFATVYMLLALDSRKPGRRVLWVLPLLALWSNLHGSVALAAALVTLYGLTLALRKGGRRRALLLIVAAPLTPLASPYGFGLVDYYRLMLFHPPLANYVIEWKPPAVGAVTVVFFATAFATAAMWGSHRKVLSPFERWALPVLLVAALVAIRNCLWFELALGVALPRLLDAVWPSRIVLTAGVRRVNLALGSAAVVGVVALFAYQVVRDPQWLEDSHPANASAAAVAAAAGRDGIVLSDDLHSDWLLWQEPSLIGRVAYDVRFELFNAHELKQLDALETPLHAVWARCGAIARVVTFPSRRYARFIRKEGVLARGSRTIVNQKDFVALTQPAAAVSRCRRL